MYKTQLPLLDRTFHLYAQGIAEFDLRLDKLSEVTKVYRDNLLTVLVSGNDFPVVQDWCFKRLLALGRQARAYTEILEELDDPHFEIAAEDMEGLL